MTGESMLRNYLMGGPDPDLSLCGSQSACFWVITQNIEERILGRSKVFGALDVGKVLHTADSPGKM